jgi:beta-glucanase (GH16 family)
MKKVLFYLILPAAALYYGCSHKSASAPYRLVWSDEFNYSGLPDPSKWSYDTLGNAWSWGNNELQSYTSGQAGNARVENGVLLITAQKETRGGKKYTSARLITKGKGDWLYGRMEIRAKLPSGRGLWPAIWMMPSGGEYGEWPDSGEIDIMENVGYDPDTIVGSAHTKSYNHVMGTHKNARISVPDCHDAFHVYILEWDPEEYRLYVDSTRYFTFRNEGTGFAAWPFNKRFHLLLNVAVGGNWGGKMGVDDSVFPQQMVVDYVRVFQKI